MANLFSECHRHCRCTEGLAGGYEEGMKRKSGPNDVNRVVWAISTCFFFIIRVFFYIY